VADTKLSALTPKTTLTGAEELYINDAGVSSTRQQGRLAGQDMPTGKNTARPAGCL